jgi:hypothetical protein
MVSGFTRKRLNAKAQRTQRKILTAKYAKHAKEYYLTQKRNGAKKILKGLNPSAQR